MIPAEAISADFLDVFECVANWMSGTNKTKPVLFSPPPAGPGDQALVDRLTAAGYTVVPDTALLPDAATIGLVIQSSSGVPDATRFTSYAAPLLSYNAANHDDELVSSIGTTAVTYPGVVQMTTPSHPASCGRTATFMPVSSEQTFDLIGATVPSGATVIANYNLVLADTVTTLARVDRMIAGTLQSAQTTATIATADLAQGAVGQWTVESGQVRDNPVPGNPNNTATFGTRGTGKLMVSAAGTYTFALSVDDGARLRIDLNRNGLDAADNVFNEEDGTGLRVLAADVTFPQTGEYDFEWVTLCTGANYGQEISVAALPGPGTIVDPWDPFDFNLLGAKPSANVALVGEITVTTYVPTGTTLLPQPFIIVTDKGGALLGGPLRGYEGDGFWGGADLNDVDYGTPSNDSVGRFLTLQPVDVRGQENLKLVLALAGSDVDFEANDFLKIWVDPDGAGPAGFQLLANYFGGTTVANTPLAGAVQDHLGNGTPVNYILRGNFRDVTYPLPVGATDLVIQFEAHCTFFNEVFAFDNVRITARGPDAPELSIRRNGANIEVHYTGTLLSSSTVDGTYTPVANAGNPHVIPPGSQSGQRFFRSRNP